MRAQMSSSGISERSESLPERHCGRCRRFFEADPQLFFQTDWALCPECTEILLPRPPARPRT